MPKHKPRKTCSPVKLILYLDSQNPQTQTAEFLKGKGFEVDIRYRDKDEETPTPWLVTPYSNFYGEDGVRNFVDYEPKLARVRQEAL